MDNEILSKFERLGARAKIEVIPAWSYVRAPFWRDPPVAQPNRPISVDIRHDDAGEYFDLRRRTDELIGRLTQLRDSL